MHPLVFGTLALVCIADAYINRPGHLRGIGPPTNNK